MATSWYERGYSVGRRWRWTVVLATIAYFIAALSAFYWHEEVFKFLLAPAEGKLSPFDGKPVVTTPTTMFGLTFGLSMMFGKLGAFPFLVVGLLALIKPLTPFNWWRRYIAVNALIAIALFALGDIFVYFVMLPVSMNFLLSFGTTVAEPVITLDSYLELLFALFKWIGVVFTIPLWMHILARLGWLSYQRAKGFYRVGFLLSLFFSAIISPGLDGTLTMMVFGAMYSLYLVGLGVVWSTDPHSGNYLFVWTIAGWLRGLRDAIRWFVQRPLVAFRWIERKLVKFGVIWW